MLEKNQAGLSSLPPEEEGIQVALMIGNSRLHWALFVGTTLQETWDTEHLNAEAVEQLSQWRPLSAIAHSQLPFLEQSGRDLASWDSLKHSALLSAPMREALSSSPVPLVFASVVPTQTALWQTYPHVRNITLDCLSLQGLYPTLGIDRALAVIGAGTELGWPVLVIDAGTALTLTGADVNQHLVGGAILPGLGLQLSSLKQKTAALPEVSLPECLPPRWALETPGAIQSGVIYTVMAGVKDFIEEWWREFPDSSIAVTGGDRLALLTYLQEAFPQIAAAIIEAPHSIFWGMSATLRSQKESVIS